MRYLNKISFLILLTLILSDNYTGYLRQTEASVCMSECSQFYIESESGDYIDNISFNDLDSSLYINRYVYVDGYQIECAECTALQVEGIDLLTDCNNPVFCFVDPCEVGPECQLNTPVNCISNYCGGCFADYYDLEGNLVDCYNSEIIEECYDVGDIFFGFCDMFMGIAIVNGTCEGISGCDWVVDGIDYSEAFFDSINECEDSCLNDPYLCEDIEYDYDQFHSGIYSHCELNNECTTVWGHCDVGLGGCHYAVNEESYPNDEINELVNLWLEGDCMGGVCDCASLPNVQCISGYCELTYCYEENPEGCFNSGCPDGYDCLYNTTDCVPSSCYCDEFYGNWYCTEDCGGGICVQLLLGDLNFDGLLNISDIVLMVNIILENTFDHLADLNNDSSVNVVDVVLLVGLILGE